MKMWEPLIKCHYISEHETEMVKLDPKFLYKAPYSSNTYWFLERFWHKYILEYTNITVGYIKYIEWLP